jgi:hypothetical protein
MACLPRCGGWFPGGSGVFRRFSVAEEFPSIGAWFARAVAGSVVSRSGPVLVFCLGCFVCFFIFFSQPACVMHKCYRTICWHKC